MTRTEIARLPSTGRRILTRHAVKQLAVAIVAVGSTAALGLTAPAAARTPSTTAGLAPMTTCMTAHQAWVWEKAILSVPAIVLVPPHICR